MTIWRSIEGIREENTILSLLNDVTPAGVLHSMTETDIIVPARAGLRIAVVATMIARIMAVRDMAVIIEEAMAATSIVVGMRIMDLVDLVTVNKLPEATKAIPTRGTNTMSHHKVEEATMTKIGEVKTLSNVRNTSVSGTTETAVKTVAAGEIMMFEEIGSVMKVKEG